MNLFCYGTLMVPEVIASLIGRSIQGTQAVLKGYRRGVIRGQTYPGILPQPEGEVSGILYQTLTEEEVMILDHYEGEMYVLAEVLIMSGAGDQIQARTYVLKEAYRALVTETDWDLAAFIRNDLIHFVRDYDGFPKP